MLAYAAYKQLQGLEKDDKSERAQLLRKFRGALNAAGRIDKSLARAFTCIDRHGLPAKQRHDFTKATTNRVFHRMDGFVGNVDPNEVGVQISFSNDQLNSKRGDKPPSKYDANLRVVMVDPESRLAKAEQPSTTTQESCGWKALVLKLPLGTVSFPRLGPTGNYVRPGEQTKSKFPVTELHLAQQEMTWSTEILEKQQLAVRGRCDGLAGHTAAILTAVHLEACAQLAVHASYFPDMCAALCSALDGKPSMAAGNVVLEEMLGMYRDETLPGADYVRYIEPYVWPTKALKKLGPKPKMADELETWNDQRAVIMQEQTDKMGAAKRVRYPASALFLLLLTYSTPTKCGTAYNEKSGSYERDERVPCVQLKRSLFGRGTKRGYLTAEDRAEIAAAVRAGTFSTNDAAVLQHLLHAPLAANSADKLKDKTFVAARRYHPAHFTRLSAGQREVDGAKVQSGAIVSPLAAVEISVVSSGKGLGIYTMCRLLAAHVASMGRARNQETEAEADKRRAAQLDMKLLDDDEYSDDDGALEDAAEELDAVMRMAGATGKREREEDGGEEEGEEDGGDEEGDTAPPCLKRQKSDEADSGAETDRDEIAE